MKNGKTIAAAALLLLVLLVGRFVWTKSVQNSDAALNQPNISQVSPYPTPDVSKIDPRAAAIMAKAVSYETQRKYQEAVELYEQALKIQDDPATRLLLGTDLVKAGRREEGIKMLKELSETQPQTWVGERAKRALAKIEKNPK